MKRSPVEVYAGLGFVNLYRVSAMNNEYLIMDAVYSDETEQYVSPCEPDIGEPVTVRLRAAAGNADAARLHIDDKIIEMEKCLTEGIYDYYGAVVRVYAKEAYYFSVVKDGRVYYFNNKGLSKYVDTAYNFNLIPGFKTPAWARGAVMYQIFVDRFYNGDRSNDVENNEYAYLGKAAKKIEKWGQPLALSDDVCNFYGGDLKGVMEKMGYIRDLGVECIYFTPLFVSPSNHKYDTQDYDYIDPHIGVIVKDGGSPLRFEKFHNKYATMYIQRTTDKDNLEASNALMCELIGTAHENGIKVILDGVFNHCGAFHKWLDKENFYYSNGYPPGAYRDAKSNYQDYFYWYNKKWPYNDCYMGWWGYDNHPKLNYENSGELYEYIMDIGRKWVSEPYCADGWRLDVAADLGDNAEFNHKFWKDFRKAVKEANPNAVIIAEHYGDAESWLNGDEWDSIMNYDAFMEPLTWFLTGMEKHSEEFKPDLLNNAAAFENTMRFYNSKLSVQSRQTSMNQLSNHDHSRFLTRTNMKAGRLHINGKKAADTGVNLSVMMSAVTFQMTWPGAPVIYYGDEAGLTGWTDPDNRRTYPWGNENKDLIEYHKTAVKLRKEHEALKTGSLQYLYSSQGVLSYGRWNENEKLAVAINNNGREAKIKLPVWKTGASGGHMKMLVLTKNAGFTYPNTDHAVNNGYAAFAMPPYSSCVLIHSASGI